MSVAGSNEISGASSGSPSRSENGATPSALAEHEQLAAGLRRRLPRNVEKRRNGQQHPRAGVGQLEAELPGGVERVGRRAPATGREHSVECDRVPEHIRHEDPERVARGEAPAARPAATLRTDRSSSA
jgi:hypothetical protein